MPWNQQGGGGSGGPWGAPPSGGTEEPPPRPGDSGSAPSGWGSRPQGNNERGSGNRGGGGGGNGGPGAPGGPDFERMFRGGQDKLKQALPGGLGSGRGIALLIAAGVAAWLASGFYTVDAGENGVVTVLGRYTERTEAGLHYTWPSPIGRVERVDVQRVQSISLGNALDRAGSDLRGRYGSTPAEHGGQMLTYDRNIVDIGFTVNWRVSNPVDYVFQIEDPRKTIEATADSVMREVVARTSIQDALSSGRRNIETAAQTELQELMTEYRAGVTIVGVNLQDVKPPADVNKAFQDVSNASQDRERRINEAQRYANEKVPSARGEAARLLNEAEGYKRGEVERARGEAGRFDDIYESYVQSKDVTLQRLYLETMEQVLAKTRKVLVEQDAAGSGVVPYLPLNEAIAPRSPAAAAATIQQTP